MALVIGGLMTQDLAIRSQAGTSDLRIVLGWPAPVRYTSTADGRELFLRFERAIGAPSVDLLPAEYPDWIDAVSAGYDSLLLRAAREVVFLVAARGSEIEVRLVPKEEPPPSGNAERRGDFRLDLLRAQLLSSTGRPREAIDLLQSLSAAYPADGQVLMALGEAYLRTGRWRPASEAYRRAVTIDARNDDARTALDAPAIRDQQSGIEVDAERREVRNAQTEDLVQINGHYLIRQQLRLGFAAAGERLWLGDARHRAQRGEVYSQYDFENGALVRGGVLLAKSGPGASLRGELPWTGGRVTAQTDYRRPYWDFPEGVIAEGIRDRVEVRAEQRLIGGLTVRAAASGNRYGTEASRRSARSAAVESGATLAIGPGPHAFGFEYAYDAEYVDRVREGGLPVVDRRVHAGSAFLDIGAAGGLRAGGFGGYALDRLGGRGPFYGGRLTFIRGGFEASLSAERRLNSVDTAQVAYRYGARVLWRFR